MRNEDRLSSLPDAILITILSLLPIEFAVSTSVLSHRWRHLWTHCTTLDIDLNRLHSNSSLRRFNDHEFTNTVNHILRQLISPKLDSVSLVFDSPFLDDEPTYTYFLQSFIPLVNARNPDNIRIISTSNDPLEPFIKLIDLPTDLFHNPSLSQLELSGPIDYNLVNNGINLPKLNMLEMSISDEQLELMNTLIKSCTNLEGFDLYIYQIVRDNGIDISSRSLRSLFVDYGYYRDLEIPHHDPTISIDTPKLEHIRISGELTYYKFVKLQTTLLTATLDLSCYALDRLEKGNYVDEIGFNIDRVSDILRGISATKSLYLSFDTLLVMDRLRYLADEDEDDNNDNDSDNDDNFVQWPVFNNLIHLSITDIGKNRELEWELVLPTSLFSNVKRVEIIDCVADSGVIDLIEYILSNALVLERLLISVCKDQQRENQLEKEHIFCEDLFMLSNGYSGNCEIEFYGLCIRKSSNEFKIRPVVHQINNGNEYLH